VVDPGGPIGWEYVLLTETLTAGLAAHQDRYEVYQRQLVEPVGDLLTDPLDAVHVATTALTGILKSIDALLTPASLEHAFGPPGVPADADAIRALAEHLSDDYAALIEWGLDVRRRVVPPTWQPVFLALAKFVRLPLHQIQDFAAEMAAGVERTVAALRAGQHGLTPLNFVLTLDIEPSAKADFDAALAELTPKG
jgi:hypothetical protein